MNPSYIKCYGLLSTVAAKLEKAMTNAKSTPHTKVEEVNRAFDELLKDGGDLSQVALPREDMKENWGLLRAICELKLDLFERFDHAASCLERILSKSSVEQLQKAIQRELARVNGQLTRVAKKALPPCIAADVPLIDFGQPVANDESWGFWRHSHNDWTGPARLSYVARRYYQETGKVGV